MREQLRERDLGLSRVGVGDGGIGRKERVDRRGWAKRRAMHHCGADEDRGEGLRCRTEVVLPPPVEPEEILLEHQLAVAGNEYGVDERGRVRRRVTGGDVLDEGGEPILFEAGRGRACRGPAIVIGLRLPVAVGPATRYAWVESHRVVAGAAREHDGAADERPGDDELLPGRVVHGRDWRCPGARRTGSVGEAHRGSASLDGEERRAAPGVGFGVVEASGQRSIGAPRDDQVQGELLIERDDGSPPGMGTGCGGNGAETQR